MKITLRKKIAKTMAVFVSAVMLIALAVFALLYFEAQDYLNKNLSEFVSKKSKGKYELSFENLQINFSDWGFEINQVSFHPTDSIIKSLNQRMPNKRLYSFSSPNIRFDQIRLFHLIWNRHLEIGGILISQPELNIIGKQSENPDKKDNINTLMQELRPLVTKSFKSIKINKIELANASFDFYNLLGDTRKLANAENVTIGILGFYTDSLILPDPNRLFNAEDIYLKMQNYQNKLADSIHALSAETVTYSLKRSKIDIENLELKPITNSFSEKGRYNIKVPKLKITSKYIHDFYKDISIPIDSLVLTDARIDYWPGLKKTKFKLETISDFDLYELIRKEFSSVSIRNINLKNAQLTLFKTPTDQTSNQELKNININLNDFLLDSASVKDTSRIFYSKNIDFSASEYELTTGDNIHRMRAGYIDLSTRKKSVLVKNFQLYPIQDDKNRTNHRNTIEANCDSVRLDQFNFKKAYHEKRFEFQRITAFNPEVKLIQNEISEEKVEPENPSFVYNLISNYAKGIYSKQVVIQKGKVQVINKTGVLQTGHIESAVKLQLSGFSLDEVSAQKTDRLFFANQIELTFSSYSMQLVDHLHKLTIGELAISSRRKMAKLENLHLAPILNENMEDLLKQYNRSELYDFSIPELTLSNIDFHEAFYNKKLSVDTLSIKTPQIYYENFALLKSLTPKADFEDFFQLLSNYLDDIHLNKVDIPEGTIRIVNHNRKGKTISLDNHFSLGLENTLVNKDQFGKKKLLFSEFIDFTIRDHIFHLSDNVHVLSAGKVGFSSRKKEIFVLNARLYPETNSKEFSAITWNIQLNIPEIRISGIDMEEYFFNRKINAESVLINSPDIKLYQQQKQTQSKGIKGFSIPLPKEIESIAIRQLNLNDGSLKVFSELGVQPYLVVQSDLKMTAQDLFILNNQESGKTEFKSGQYLSELFQLKFTPKDKNQQFSIDDITLSTADRRILAHQLVVKPKTKSSKQDQFELHIPTLSMNGFDIDKAYQNDDFFFESINIENPDLQIYNNAKDSMKFDPYKLDLYSHFESFASIFASKSLRVSDADISVFKSGQKKFQEKISFDLSNFRIDNRPSTGFMHSEDFSLRIPNVKRQSKLYQYGIGEIFYSSRNNRITAKNIRISPIFSKDDYQKKVGFQSDYFNVKIDSVYLRQPNIRQWFNKQEVSGKYLSVNGLNMDIYRDKQIAFNENRRPKMLQDMIKSAKYPFMVDSFNLVNSNVTYAERPISGEAEGKIRFNNLKAGLKPFTNMKTSGGKIPDFTLVGSATIMDSTVVKATINYQMNHPDNQFSVTGSLSPFHMRILNPVLEPLSSVSIRSGKVDRFEFNFVADKNKATGSLLFGYNDLRISVLETKKGNIKESKLASFLANSLLLRTKNPRGKELLPDEISFQKDQTRSDLNYWWKSVLSGIRNTLGIKDSKQQE